MAAAFLLLLTVTGVVLGHARALRLHERHIPRVLTAWVHRGSAPRLVHFAVGGHLLSQLGDSVYWDLHRVIDLDEPLRGAVALGETVAVAAAGTIVLMGRGGEVIERLGPGEGVPSGIRRIGRMRALRLVLQAGRGTGSFDLDTLQWRALERPAVDLVSWSRPATAPHAVREALLERYLGPGISWEEAILALHTGRVLGRWGSTALDAAAVSFVALAVSGLWLWARRPR